MQKEITVGVKENETVLSDSTSANENSIKRSCCRIKPGNKICRNKISEFLRLNLPLIDVPQKIES